MPTPEELATAIPPQDVIAELNACSEKSGMPMDQIKMVFYKILAQPFLDQFTEIDDRCRNASKVMISQLEAKMSQGGVKFWMEFHIIDVTSVAHYDAKVEKVDPMTQQKVQTTEQRTRATVYGIFVGSKDNDSTAPEFPLKLGVLNLWGDACQMISMLKKDKNYKMRLTVKDQQNRYELSANDFDTPQEIQLDVPSNVDIMRKFFEEIPISQALYHQGDFKMLRGRIKNNRTQLSKKGKNIGYVYVTDSNNTSNMKEMSISFFNSPEMATRYTSGSDCLFMCNVKEGDERYGGVSISGEFIVPIVAIDNEIPNFFNAISFNSAAPAPAPAPAPASTPAPASSPVQAPPAAPETPAQQPFTAPANAPSTANVGRW